MIVHQLVIFTCTCVIMTSDWYTMTSGSIRRGRPISINDDQSTARSTLSDRSSGFSAIRLLLRASHDPSEAYGPCTRPSPAQPTVKVLSNPPLLYRSQFSLAACRSREKEKARTTDIDFLLVSRCRRIYATRPRKRRYPRPGQPRRLFVSNLSPASKSSFLSITCIWHDPIARLIDGQTDARRRLTGREAVASVVVNRVRKD